MKRNSKQLHQTKYNKTRFNDTSNSLWTLLIPILLFLLVAPFYRALFNGYGLWNGIFFNSYAFETPIYGALQWITLILIVVSLFIFVKWKSYEQSIDSSVLAVWLIPLSFVLSSFHAVSTHTHMLSIFIHIAYAGLFVASFFIVKSKNGNVWLLSSIIGSGYLIILFGLFNLFGDASFGGLITYENDVLTNTRTYHDAVIIEGRGLRLTSVFQYANTYAAYLIALILCSLVLLVSVKNKGITLLSAFMLLPSILSFLLTQSRGGMVVFPVLFVLVLFLLNMRRQIMTIVHFLIPASLAILILQPVNNIALEMQENFSTSGFLQGWSIVIAASLVTMGLCFTLERLVSPLVQHWTKGISSRKASNSYIPICIVVLGVIGGFFLFGNSNVTQALPDALEQRITAINLQTHSVLERATFYANAMEIIKDYPWFGAGGGAWAALFETYQTNPYTSRQAHNFFLQYMMETGVIGFAILAAFIFLLAYFFLREFWRKNEQDRLTGLLFFIIVLAILLHSAIDFDMSYVYIGAIVFLCLGGMAAEIKRPAFFFQNHRLKLTVRKVYPSVLIVLAVIVFVFSARYAQANRLYQQSIQHLQDQQTISEILAPLEQAIEVREHPDYLNYQVSLYSQIYNQTQEQVYYNQAKQTIDRLLEKVPYNKITYYQAYNLYIMQDQLEAALSLVQTGLERFPWEISFYERAMILNYELSIQNAEQQTERWQTIIALHENIKMKQEHLKSLPEAQLQGRDFDLSKDMALILGEIYFKTGEYETAIQVIDPLMDRTLQEPVDLALARYYLASKLQLGQEDVQLYAQIEQNHSELIDQIKILVEND